ncbi:MAG: MATE family efflux transporter [Bacteroidales bacterium]|nr:MATE family efflux transporter [Bacteroidales bacterium]
MSRRLDFIELPIPVLIRKLAIPTSVGFFFNTMFNVVDTWFAGLISTAAQAGMALSFPVFFIILSVGMGIGTGTTALIANSMGKRDEEGAKIFARQALVFGFVISVVLSIIGYLVVPYLFRFMNAEGEYLALALDYMNVILFCTVTFLMNGILNGILSSRGDTISFRNFLIAGALANIILDPVLMYGWVGLPAMGIEGIALATVIIQFGGTLYLGYRVRRTELFALIEWQLFYPRKSYLKEIMQQGFPASFNMMTIAVGIFIITWFVSAFGQDGVAAYGIATRIEQIALLPTIGLNIAALSIVGNNFGAGRIDRVLETYRKNLKYGIIVMSIGMVWVFLFSDQLMGFFTKNETVIKIGATYLEIATLIFNAYLLLNVSIAVMQGLKMPMLAVWIGIYRQFFMPMLVLTLFTQVLGFELLGIWWGIVAINWSAAIIAVIYTLRKLKSLSLHPAS